MFAWIIGTSLRFRFLILAIAVALLVFGGQQLRRMPVDVFPEFAPPKVEIQTEGPGMTSVEVEELITIPMEEALRGVPNVDVIRSSSVVGLSQVNLLFKRGTDLMEARQRVSERVKLAIAELPQSAGMPVMLQPLSSTSRVMKIGISSKTIRHDGSVDDRLLDDQVPSDVRARRGQHSDLGRSDQVAAGASRSEPDARARRYARGGHGDDLRRARFRIAEVHRRSEDPNRRHAGHAQPADASIHYQTPVFSPEHLAEVPLALKNKRRTEPPRLRDVADVKWDTWPMIGDAVINDEVGLMMIVEKLPWANTLDVTRGVEEALASLKPGLPGIEIDSTIFRPATFIELSIDNLTMALIIGSRSRGHRARRLPLRMARCADQRHRDSRCRSSPPASCSISWGDDQHDGAGRVRRCSRRCRG